MAEWVWEARARTGEVRTGTMEAENADAVEQRLKSQQLSPTKVKKKAAALNFSLSFGSGVTERDLMIWTRQFATMIDAGLPLVQCLDLLSQQGENEAFNKLLLDVKGYVEGGGTFSEGLARHPAVFDPLMVNLINAGEVGGILDSILQRLATYIEKRMKLRGQVKSAMVYPAVTLFVALAVVFVMLYWVIPAFESVFTQFDAEDEMPALTRAVMDLSHFVVDAAPFLLIGIIAFGAGIRYSFKNPKSRRVWHSFMLKAPVLGPVFQKIAVSRFTRTLGTLLGSGVPILDALDIVSRASGNMVIEEAINTTTDRIREGRTMSEPLLATGIFPGMVVQMIGVGEQTGALDVMLNKIADFYEEEVDAAVAGLTSLIEPLMMVFIGGVVGTMLIAMYLPIFALAGAIEGG